MVTKCFIISQLVRVIERVIIISIFCYVVSRSGLVTVIVIDWIILCTTVCRMIYAKSELILKSLNDVNLQECIT